MSTITLTGRENLTNYTFWLGPLGPIDKENQVKMYKKNFFRYITVPLGIGKDSDPDQTVGSGSVSY